MALAVAALAVGVELEEESEVVAALDRTDAPRVIGPVGRWVSLRDHFWLFNPLSDLVLSRRLNQQGVRVEKFMDISTEASWGSTSWLRTTQVLSVGGAQSLVGPSACGLTHSHSISCLVPITKDI